MLFSRPQTGAAVTRENHAGGTGDRRARARLPPIGVLWDLAAS
jgi:hypothetical protein